MDEERREGGKGRGDEGDEGDETRGAKNNYKISDFVISVAYPA